MKIGLNETVGRKCFDDSVSMRQKCYNFEQQGVDRRQRTSSRAGGIDTFNNSNQQQCLHRRI